MTRKSLPYTAWPDVDRRAWTALFVEGDVIEGRGAGAHWAEATRRTNRAGYGRWLGWLAAQAALVPGCTPADRATPERVDAYARELIATVAPRTAESLLRTLKVVLKAMAPERDWRWLMAMTNRLKAWATPVDASRPPALSLSQMFHGTLRALDRLADAAVEHRRAALDYRDTLLVGVLISAPVRRRNLGMIHIGDHLRRVGSAWRLEFAASETKTGQPVRLVLHADLGRAIGHFIEAVRPTLPGANETDVLWLTATGGGMAQHTIYEVVRRVTTRLFGVPINPHRFRTLAATTLAESGAGDARRAPALLGHRDPSVTETHYIRANQIEASRKIAEALQRIRGSD